MSWGIFDKIAQKRQKLEDEGKLQCDDIESFPDESKNKNLCLLVSATGSASFAELYYNTDFADVWEMYALQLSNKL